MIVIGTILLFIVLLISVFAFVLSLSFFFGAPFVTTPSKIINEMFKLVGLNSQDVLIDMGSGDGRILIAAGKICKKTIGYEINPFLVLWTNLFAHINGVQNEVHVYMKNYQKANIKEGTIIILYSIRGHLPKIEKKIKKELKPGVKIISYKFPLSNFALINKTDSGIFLYTS